MRLTTGLGRGLMALAVSLFAGGACAGEADTALLQSLIGSFKGKGDLLEGDTRREVDCRLAIGEGNRGKLVFRAQCPVVAGTGAIAYNEAAGRFEIVFTASTDFGGTAAGKRSGDGLVFNIVNSAVDGAGNALDYTVKAALSANTIEFVFDATLNEDPWKGTLTFTRSGG